MSKTEPLALCARSLILNTGSWNRVKLSFHGTIAEEKTCYGKYLCHYEAVQDNDEPQYFVRGITVLKTDDGSCRLIHNQKTVPFDDQEILLELNNIKNQFYKDVEKGKNKINSLVREERRP